MICFIQAMGKSNYLVNRSMRSLESNDDNGIVAYLLRSLNFKRCPSERSKQCTSRYVSTTSSLEQWMSGCGAFNRDLCLLSVRCLTSYRIMPCKQEMTKLSPSVSLARKLGQQIR